MATAGSIRPVSMAATAFGQLTLEPCHDHRFELAVLRKHRHAVFGARVNFEN